MTISPSRLNNVETAATHKALVQDNFEILAEEIAKRVATYNSGTPTTIIGPPTSGDRVLNEFWRDALGGEWRCTAAGTPGTWIQIKPAYVSADPSSGTIPTGYLILNVTEQQLKHHEGSYEWHSAGVVVLNYDIGDETTDLTTGTAKKTFRAPFDMHIVEARINVNTAPLGSTIQVDINEGGASIFSTVLEIDTNEMTSTTAATPAVISDPEIADDAEMTVDIDQVGSGTAGKGLKLILIGYRT